ncbi:unnamed protein product [Closterium sp. NIES-53]
MTTLQVLLHIAAQRDYELHSLDFSTAFLKGSLHEEIRLRRPPGFTGSFPTGTQWSLRRPGYGLRQAPREWYDTLRTTLAALGFAPSTADPSLFLRTDTSLPSFYVLVYIDDLVFATTDTEALTLVKSELQKRHTYTDLGELSFSFGFQFSSPQPTPLSTRHSLSAPPSDESVEPSGPYPELVGCLMYLMTCTRPNLAYPLSLLARYVAPGRHRKVHWDAAKRVLHYLCSTSGMGLVLGGRGPVVLTGHADASWVHDSATQRSSQGYTFSLGSMAAQELRWLTYLLSDLGEQPHLPPVLYQRGQLRLAYVATRANTADIFTKALPPACFAFLDSSCDLLFSPTLPMGRLTLQTYLNNLAAERDLTGGFRGNRAFATPADKADWDEKNVDGASEEAGPLLYCSVPVPMHDKNPRESINAEVYYDFADNEAGDEAVYPEDPNLPRYTQSGLQILGLVTTVHGALVSREPATVQQALGGEHREKWRGAMDRELKFSSSLVLYSPPPPTADFDDRVPVDLVDWCGGDEGVAVGMRRGVKGRFGEMGEGEGGGEAVKPAAPVARETVAPVAREPVAPVTRESVAPAVRLAAEPVTPVALVPVAPFASVSVAPVARVPAASAATHHLLSSHGPSSS